MKVSIVSSDGFVVNELDILGVGGREELYKTMDRFLVTYAMEKCEGSVSKAAKYLGMKRTNLVYICKKFGIESSWAKKRSAVLSHKLALSSYRIKERNYIDYVDSRNE